MNKPKPITQRLRHVELTYMMEGKDHTAVRQARQLITDLWDLHWKPESDFHEQAAKLFADAGLPLNETK